MKKSNKKKATSKEPRNLFLKAIQLNFKHLDGSPVKYFMSASSKFYFKPAEASRIISP